MQKISDAIQRTYPFESVPTCNVFPLFWDLARSKIFNIKLQGYPKLIRKFVNRCVFTARTQLKLVSSMQINLIQ